jgi:imidazolonepropionase-like amidohydrolase
MPLHVRAVVLPDEAERDIYVTGDRLTFEPVAGAETVVRSGWAIPGLVDAHCHIGLVPPGAAATVEQARELAMVDRTAGALTIRDAGSPTPYAQLDDDPEMPRLLRAGKHIAPPKRYIPNIAVDATGPELPAAVAEQAKAGNGWVKIVGDWIDRSAGDLGANYDRESLTQAVKAAHDNGARMTVHTFSEDALPDLLAAGLDCIEHGTGLSKDLLDVMAKAGTALVPTMINIETFGGIAEKAQAKFPAYADHMRRLMAGFPSVVAAAYEAGVPIFAGTDAGGGIDHGLIAEEIRRLHQTGMSAVDALAAGSWKARDWLGLSGITEGGLADLVIYDRDPRLDLGILRTPARMILRGHVIM